MQIWLHQLESLSLRKPELRAILLHLNTSAPKNSRTPSCKTHGNTRAGERHSPHQLQHADYK